ncbi:MAG: hypothetical protein U0W65_15430 [Bacteroidia bacterium]
MNIKNIFKKENKTVAKANVEKLEKNQLEKVVGGAEVGSVPFVGGVLAGAAKTSSGLSQTGSAISNGTSA